MKITILGTGAFGLALGSLWHQYSNSDIIFWTSFQEEEEEITKHHTYQRVLPGITLKEDLVVTKDLKEAIRKTNLIVLAVPCGAVRSVLKQVNEVAQGPHHYLFVSKGLEKGSNDLMYDIFKEQNTLGTFSYLAGPTFAKELIQNIPTGMTLATREEEVEAIVKTLFQNTAIEIEISRDLIGVEYASVIKNILAIFMGALGVRYDIDSTKAYFLTEMVHQMESLLISLGGEKRTIYTYSGIGDLILTCNSINSRNYRYGRLLEQDREKAEEFLHANTVEGRYALDAILEVCQEKKISASLLIFMKDYIDKKISLEEIFKLFRKE
ncbi:MAG TPA: NAD(P)-binding domain-containing protein [Candidatus Onthousia faecigallinarum]|nr:NAD(P)-binding domain-containing protein [Candidatus Onthousia faecigallinarum]